jgi:hypothetical protein
LFQGFFGVVRLRPANAAAQGFGGAQAKDSGEIQV